MGSCFYYRGSCSVSLVVVMLRCRLFHLAAFSCRYSSNTVFKSPPEFADFCIILTGISNKDRATSVPTFIFLINHWVMRGRKIASFTL